MLGEDKPEEAMISKKMTAEDRAQAIIEGNVFQLMEKRNNEGAYDKIGDVVLKDSLEQEIRNQIIQAETLAAQEAREICDHSGPCDECIDKFRAQGFASGAEAMREACASLCKGYCGTSTSEFSEGKQMACSEIENAIRALPLPSVKS